jgi:hypothetical protein
MSREQRRLDRRQQARTAAKGPSKTPASSARPATGASRRTPVKVRADRGFPVVPFAIAGGTALVILLIVYLVYQAAQGSGLSGPAKAEANDDPSLPGAYYPTQGRSHFPGSLEGHVMTPFCPDVPASQTAADRSGKPFGSGTPGATVSASPQPTSTPTATATSGSGATSTTDPNASPTPRTDCYSSNPPSSGKHLNVQRNVDVGGGIINIPPDPDVYPDDIEIPRDAIPHILEHAGVFVGWNCASGDSGCEDAVQQVKDLVNDRIDDGKRVVMAHDLDLPENTIGISSWTRAEQISTNDWNSDKLNELKRFINTHSCRFDPEGFCR